MVKVGMIGHCFVYIRKVSNAYFKTRLVTNRCVAQLNMHRTYCHIISSLVVLFRMNLVLNLLKSYVSSYIISRKILILSKFMQQFYSHCKYSETIVRILINTKPGNPKLHYKLQNVSCPLYLPTPLSSSESLTTPTSLEIETRPLLFS